MIGQLRLAFVLVAFAALIAFCAHGEDLPKPPPEPVRPIFTFSEVQTRIIVDTALAKRQAAADEYKRWDDLLMEVQRQQSLMQAKPAEAAKP